MSTLDTIMVLYNVLFVSDFSARHHRKPNVSGMSCSRANNDDSLVFLKSRRFLEEPVRTRVQIEGNVFLQIFNESILTTNKKVVKFSPISILASILPLSNRRI